MTLSLLLSPFFQIISGNTLKITEPKFRGGNSSMKYHMRKADREIQDPVQLEAVIKNGKYAVIAMCRNNEPYIVTLSYGYDEADHALYFHGAKDGLKIEFLKANPEVCLTIIHDQGYIPQVCSHAYKTVVIRGKMEPLEHDKDYESKEKINET